jgi:hypothetical protein
VAVQLTWNTNPTLSALHTAFCVSNFPDSLLLPDLTGLGVLGRLGEFADRLDVPPDRFWDLAFQTSADSSGSHEQAERLCIRTLPEPARTPLLISELKAELASIRVVFESMFPKFAEEMQLRQAPLREQWEAYGPGLWSQLCSLVDADIFVNQAEVSLLMPVVGGFGWAQLQTNRIQIEAVLTNANPQITEVTRLAWLLGQLDFDRPRYSDLINTMRLRKVAGLAMLPPVLMAGEELGLCSLNAETLRQAIELWKIMPSGNKTEAISEVLMIWWETFRSGQTDWSVALTGLDRMLSI